MEINLHVDKFSGHYKSPSQLVRAVSEDWFAEEMHCPNCLSSVERCPPNTKSRDFLCLGCDHSFELKSHKSNIPNTIPDGAYEALINIIQSGNAPDFFFLSYDPDEWQVSDLFLVPRFFFNRSVIEKRPPLSRNARRAGWVGCNIRLDRIPTIGRIGILCNKKAIPWKEVKRKYHKAGFLDSENLEQKGWFSDILRCAQSYRDEFSLRQFYSDFEDELGNLHPENKHIRDKIRQQLQVLRDRGFLRFLGKGRYGQKR